MSFYNVLEKNTENERNQLLHTTPIISRCLAGSITVEDYVSFLIQAYHHVRHTVPLLMALGSRIEGNQEWLRNAVAHYISEELGHQEWILDDIAACGHDREAAAVSEPNIATELMVAYAYDTIQRGNPLGFFGMVFVLEGTSIGLADQAADSIQRTTGLPDNAFHYLRSHGAIDQSHIVFFRDLMNRLDDLSSQQAIIHSAKVFYKLYGDVFRSLEPTDYHPSRLEEVAQCK